MMPPIKGSKKSLICIVALAVVLFGATSFVYVNRTSRLRVLQARIEVKQQELDDSKRIADRLAEVERQYRDTQAMLAFLEQGVSTRAYVPTFLRQLEELGKAVHLRVVGVRPKAAQGATVTPSSAEGQKVAKKKKEEPYQNLDIDFEVSGRYWDIVSFLQELPSFPKIIAVHELQVLPAPDTGRGQARGASPMLTAKISTTAFILKENGQAVPAGNGDQKEGDDKRLLTYAQPGVGVQD